MKNRLCTLLLLLSLAVTWASPSAALSCMEIAREPREWTEAVVKESAYVFLARVTDVSETSANVSIEVTRQLKGKTKLRSLYAGFRNFPLARGEERVFFVNEEGVVLPCTEYRHLANEKELVKIILDVLRKNAT